MPIKVTAWFLAALLWSSGLVSANPLLDRAADWRDALPAIELPENAPLTPEGLSFVDRSGARVALSASRGRFRLVNLWAVWCAPCREEMPALDRLADRLSDRDFMVLTVASGPHSIDSITSFYERVGVENLPIYRDPKSQLAAQLGAIALPSTFLIDPDGHVMARLVGDAQWDSPVVTDLIGTTLSEYD